MKRDCAKNEKPTAIIVQFATQFLVTLEITSRYGSIISVTIQGIRPALGSIRNDRGQPDWHVRNSSHQRRWEISD